jgi:hypothetical protein
MNGEENFISLLQIMAKDSPEARNYLNLILNPDQEGVYTGTLRNLNGKMVPNPPNQTPRNTTPIIGWRG